MQSKLFNPDLIYVKPAEQLLKFNAFRKKVARQNRGDKNGPVYYLEYLPAGDFVDDKNLMNMAQY